MKTDGPLGLCFGQHECFEMDWYMKKDEHLDLDFGQH